MATSIQTKPSIHEIAREVFLAAKGDEVKARQRWLSLVRHDPALVAEALNYCATLVVSTQISAQRHTSLRAVHVNEDRGTRDNGLAARAESNLMTFPLPQNHKPLGQATKKEVQEALFWHRTQRNTHGMRERWFGLIWQAMKDAALPVKRQLSETDLRNMATRARKEEAAR